MAQPSEAQVFERLQSYSFVSDPEFANGLAIILGHPDTPATEVEMNWDDDLVLQAKCFFFSRYAGNLLHRIGQVLIRVQERKAHSSY